MMQKIRWGIIGLGNIAKIFAESFNNVENAELAAIASKDPKKINEFKSKFKLDSKLCYNNYEDLVGCKDIDAVYIALPNSYHYEWVKECLKNNKNVLVEKPFTLSISEILNIKKLFLKNKVFVSEALHYCYIPQTLKVIELIKENKIGNLISMESYFGHNLLTKKNIFGFTKKKKIKGDNRLFNKQLGGGAIFDLGCYPVSLSTLLASTISEVQVPFDKITFSKNIIIKDSFEVDVDSYLDINFEDKFTSSIGVSYKKNLGKETKIIGSKGSIIVKDTWHGMPSIITVSGEFNQEISLDRRENVYSYQTESVSRFILQGNKQAIFPGPSIEDSVKNIKIIETWRKLNYG